MQVFILGAHPILQDALQFKRILTELLLGLLRILTIELQQIRLSAWLHLYILIGAGAVVKTWPCDRHRWRVVGWAAHLVDVPVGLQVAQVTNTRVGTYAFYLLVVPQGEGVVITVREDDRVSFILHGHEVVLTEVATGVTTGAVVVIPCLTGHLDGYNHTGYTHSSGNGGTVHFLQTLL